MGIYETLYAFRDSFGKFMGSPGTHPWSQGFPLTTKLEGGPGRPLLPQGVGPSAAARGDRHALQQLLRLAHRARERDGVRRRAPGHLRGARVPQEARRGAHRQRRVAGISRHPDADRLQLARGAVHARERLPPGQRDLLRPHRPQRQDPPAAGDLESGQPDRPHPRRRRARRTDGDGRAAEERHPARRGLRDVPRIEGRQRHPLRQGPRQQQRVPRRRLHQGPAVPRHPHW
jgi:hypothetical protein